MIDRFVVSIVAGASLCLSAWGSAAAQDLLPGEREVQIEEIPGVIAADARWEIFWADFYTADGIGGMPDGSVLFAQEQTDTVRKITPDGRETVFLKDMNGPGSISMDTEGRVFGVQRTCTEPFSPAFESCPELTRVAQFYPVYRILAQSFPNGDSLGRVNDLVTDGRGGAYFTAGGIYYVSAEGEVATVADRNIRTNGLMLSRDGRTLYVTDNTVVVAFDVARDGSTSNRREFGTLNGDDGGDGMAIDADDRLYVTGNAGVHVLAPDGDYLGLIPTPRRPITVAFAGPDKQTLYAPQMGAIGPDGKAWTTREGVRNTAMTIYRIPMIARGFPGRP